MGEGALPDPHHSPDGRPGGQDTRNSQPGREDGAYVLPSTAPWVTALCARAHSLVKPIST